MSRSPWASTEPAALASAVLRGAGRGARLVHRGRLEHPGLGAPRPSKRGLLRIVVAVVPLTSAPLALANPSRNLHSHHQHSTIHRRARTRSTTAADVHRTPGIRDQLRHASVVLSRGSGYGTATGSALVRTLQVQLARAGDAPGPIDGLYGPLTQASVRAFQAAHGLTIDGIAGPRTVAELTARNPALYPGAGVGTGGAAPVRLLQRRLAKAGDPPGPVDGIFGPVTERAVRRFQAEQGLTVDGIAGRRTLALLHPRPVSRRVHQRAARPKPSSPRSPVPHHPRIPRRNNHPSSAGQPHRGHRAKPAAGWDLPAGIAAAALLLLTAVVYRRRRRGDPHPSPARARYAVPAKARAADRPLPGAPDTASPRYLEDELKRAGGPPEASKAFDEAVRREQQNDRAGAKAAYGRADEAGHPGAACNLGVMMEVDGDVRAARAAYERADQRGDANGAFNLGCLFEEQGNWNGARDAYKRADQRGHAEAATNLGVLLEVRGETAGARAAYERAEQRGDPNGAANLGALLEELGEHRAAGAAYRRAEQMTQRPVRTTTRTSPVPKTANTAPPEPEQTAERGPTSRQRGEGT